MTVGIVQDIARLEDFELLQDVADDFSEDMHEHFDCDFSRHPNECYLSFQKR